MAKRSYRRTRPGKVEIKRLPPVRAYETPMPPTSRRRARNDAFSRLFGYLKGHDLNMTTPVEVAEGESMRFLVGPDAKGRKLPAEGDVRVVELPERTVVSAGHRGGYSRRNVRRCEKAARDWLDTHPDWRAAGPAEVAYWNGPMMPAPLRRMEVHLPVEPNDARVGMF